MSIELKNITKSFDGKTVLDGISFTVPEKGIFGIFGPSGSGKTTLLRLICGLEKPDSGEITGTKGKKFSVVFQEDRLIDTLSSAENIALVSNTEKAGYFLEKVGLSDAAGKYPPELSGGMSRRVAIARALAYAGDILILDEPFKGLETGLKERIKDIICEYAQSHSVILVTHDEEEKLLAENFKKLG